MENRDSTSLRPGEIVNGRFEVVRCLGAGSMGVVYACKHRELKGHFVALKVLYPEVARDPVSLQRLQNEIVASYAVSHKNVIRTYEYFKDGDLFAFTMEYVKGGDLADRLAEQKPFSIAEVLRLLSQVAAGVEAIHAAGIIHRDLKPENLLITPEGLVKITDFGIARSSGSPRLTEHGGLVGTLDYVSPEYLESGHVDERADIYAIGVLAYEMISGRAPFQGRSVLETMSLRLKTEPELLTKIRSDCPKLLGDIVRRAMAREVSKRYSTAGELLSDLKKVDIRKSKANQVSSPKAAAVREVTPGGVAGPEAKRPLQTARAAEQRKDSVVVGRTSLATERVRSLSSQIVPSAEVIRGHVWLGVCVVLLGCFVLAISIYSSQVNSAERFAGSISLWL